MPALRRRIAALAAVALLAAPSSALAQSAGDEQYQDPFAGEDQGQSQGGSDQESSPTPAPAAPAPSASETGAAPSAGQPQLPRTGAEIGLVVLAGTVLLAGGVALRVRLRERS